MIDEDEDEYCMTMSELVWYASLLYGMNESNHNTVLCTVCSVFSCDRCVTRFFKILWLLYVARQHLVDEPRLPRDEK